MIIERFKDGDPVPVYRRLRDWGRMLPEGLEHRASWVDANLERCFQVMETSEPALINDWAAGWDDIVEFEVVPVVSSAEAVELAEALM